MARGDGEHGGKNGHDNRVIIIRRKKVISHGHHGGAWKVAFADFVTALMALFIVLWVIGQSKEVREYVSEYFRDPGAFNSKTKATIITANVQSLGEDATGLKRTKHNDSTGQEARKFEAERRALSEVERKLREMLDDTPEFSTLRTMVEIELTAEGLRIQLIDEQHASIFDLGSARLQREAMHLLTKIGQELAALPNQVIIEGHTDSRPYSAGNGYSNWELSADRANAARRVLESAGVRRDQIRQVRGFADRMLRNTDNPFDIHNRRVSIIVLFDRGDSGEQRYLPENLKYIPLR